MSALPPKADINPHRLEYPLSANSGHFCFWTADAPVAYHLGDIFCLKLPLLGILLFRFQAHSIASDLHKGRSSHELVELYEGRVSGCGFGRNSFAWYAGRGESSNARG